MDVLFVRHAIAEDRDVFAQTGKPDDLRPLTPDGRKKMRQIAAGLQTLVPEIDLLATSPLVRAIETANILAEAYGDIEPIAISEMEPGANPKHLESWLAEQEDDISVAVVGHEPSLGLHVSWLTGRADDSFVEFKKGGVCLLRFYDEVYSGGATLRWLLTPAQLRRLGA